MNLTEKNVSLALKEPPLLLDLQVLNLAPLAQQDLLLRSMAILNVTHARQELMNLAELLVKNALQVLLLQLKEHLVLILARNAPMGLFQRSLDLLNVPNVRLVLSKSIEPSAKLVLLDLFQRPLDNLNALLA